MNYIPKRADMVWMNFDPQAGGEIQKTRPAVILSPFEYNNRVGRVLCIPVTNKVRGYSFEVLIQTDQIQGVALCDHIHSFDWKARRTQYILTLDKMVFFEIKNKTEVLLH